MSVKDMFSVAIIRTPINIRHYMVRPDHPSDIATVLS